jgi:hypothetical protein
MLSKGRRLLLELGVFHGSRRKKKAALQIGIYRIRLWGYPDQNPLLLVRIQIQILPSSLEGAHGLKFSLMKKIKILSEI